MFYNNVMITGKRNPGAGRSSGRVHGRHGAAPAGPGAIPGGVPVRAQGAGPRHHLLDSLPLFTLDRVTVT